MKTLTPSKRKQTKMKALKKENQAALDEFCKNEFWRTYYEKAPVVAREFIENGFRHSADPHGDDKILKEERKRKYADLYGQE